MTIFAIIAPSFNASLQESVRRNFPKNLEFAPGQFVAAANGLTAQQVAVRIGADGSKGKFVVFSVAAHWGYHDKTLWEWMTVNAS